MTETTGAPLRRTVGVIQGVGLYIGAVLGPGLLVLPSVAAETAGPASLLAWGLLIVLSLPLALTFAALARAYPQVGGFAASVERAFGPTWGAVTGWLFFFCIPSGSVVVAMIAGQYVGGALGLERGAQYVIGGAIVLAAYAVNLVGLRLSGRVQVLVVIGIIGLLTLAIAGALPRIERTAFTPFFPYGPLAVGTAAVQLFWAIAGWEAVTPLAEEFHDPGRDMWRATVIAVAAVGLTYGALALATVGTHAYGDALRGAAPLGAMAEASFGIGARVAAGVIAAFVSFGTVNAYLAGTSRLGYALGRADQLPRWFGVLNPRWLTPHHALAFLGTLFLFLLAASYFLNWTVAELIPISTSSYIVTYLLSMGAATRLLTGRARVAAWLCFATCLIVLVFVGAFFIWVAGVTLACLLYQRYRAGANGARTAAMGK